MTTNVECSNISVLHVGAGRYRPGETGHSTFEIWREISKGFRRYTVVGRSTHPRRAAFCEGNVDVRLIPSWIESESEFLFTQFEIESIAAEVEADVVVAQCPVLGGLVAARIAKQRGAKVLVEFHMGHYFQNNSLVSRNRILELLTRINLGNAARIRVLSEGMRQQLLSKFGAEYGDRVVVLPPRVDLTQFSRFKRDWQLKGRLKVIVVGSVNYRKGQLRLLQAILPAKIDVEIWIVGAGPDLEACRSLAVQARSEDRVRIFGQISHAELANLLPRADVMVLFSNMEGTPRALMEGMAAGLPIVTTNAGFCADVVENGVQGFVLGDEPSVEIVSCLRRLLVDEKLRERMGRAGRARAEADFDAAKVYERYRALIRETAEA